jgi:hypothetical protein
MKVSVTPASQKKKKKKKKKDTVVRYHTQKLRTFNSICLRRKYTFIIISFDQFIK